jgi:uncharacterized repeat protein (TIGR03803 family)
MNLTPHSRIHMAVRLLLIGFALAVLCATSWAASEKVLYRFHGTDGNGPVNVIIGPDGALYGTTVEGGNACSCGVVFQLTHGPDGKWHEKVLHDFTGSDGEFPNGALVADKAGNLYGTTVYGASNGCSNMGCGVIFELVRGDGNSWTYKMLYNFSSGGGLWPYAGLIFDSQGNLYGTTSHGGNTSACAGGCGVVFELSPDGKGDWTETVLYSFSGKDGEWPSAPLVFDPSGDLFGVTEHGGAHGGGTVFRLSLTGSQWSEEVLHSFSLDTGDGYEPAYGLVFDPSGNLYGTTTFGGMKGAQGWGTAFKLTPAGGGRWKEAVLHTYDRDKGVGGGFLSSGLILDAAGNLYGSAGAGGKYNCGAVFKLTTTAKGKWGETVLHPFGKGNDGCGPIGGLVFDSSDRLLGSASIGGLTGGSCGQGGCGVVFEITP